MEEIAQVKRTRLMEALLTSPTNEAAFAKADPSLIRAIVALKLPEVIRRAA